jgi:SAM-dependent methyltransferase
MGRSKPAFILEVGCGNSIWLPYVGLKTGAAVAGLDYSEVGCELARSQLAAAGVPGKVFCGDLFNVNTAEVGRYDFVFSLGMVEHFTDTVEVLSKLLELVNPGGVLFTEVPNLKSIHGLLSWIWQPELLAKHNPLGKRDLIAAYRRLGLEGIEGHYVGVFSLDIVAWPIYPRWPRRAPRLLPTITRARNSVDYRMRRWGRFEGGTAPLAPYLCVIGRKPTRQGA